jgi:glyoxylase-like metal-dependent hydrolase (beta-lactamase superfamily II)
MNTHVSQSAAKASQEANFQTWHVGDVKVTRIPEAMHAFPLTALFEEAADLTTEKTWLRPEFIDENGDGLFSVHSYVLEVGDRRIIVDTGNGNGKERVLFETANELNTPFLEDLAAAGYSAETIDTVLCTHLHGDHVGGSTRLVDGEWTPTFPNARYMWNPAEIEHWRQVALNPQTPFDHEQTLVYYDSVAPVVAAGLVYGIEGGYEVTPEISLEPTPGHTPGHMSVRILSQGKEAWLLGDVAHHPVQLVKPDWGFADDDPEVAKQVRRNLFERFATNDVLVFGGHWAGRNAVYLDRDGTGYRVRDSDA